MTRINLVPPEELCDQHLLAEHRELTRIPNGIARGKYVLRAANCPLDGSKNTLLILIAEKLKN